MAWIKWLGLALVVFAVIMVGMRACGAWCWAASTRALMSRLEGAREAAAPSPYDARELDGLPAPVQRYFRAALQDGQPIVTAASVEHAGSFNLGERADQWKPFTSTQRVVTRRPGFVWDGRVMAMPGLPVLVHDAYVAGEGILHPAILGLITLIDLRGTGELAQGELMRYFAEASWYPTALLPRQGVRWEAVDDNAARATLVDQTISVTLLFRFGENGLIDSVLAQARGRMVGKSIVMTPWEGRWTNYQERNGMQVPMTGEVAWLTPQGRKPYWRGTIKSLTYEFAC